MPIITPRNVATNDGKYEVSIYRGALDDRVEFGVKTKALIDQNNDWEHWHQQTRVYVGYRMRRAVRGYNGTDWTFRGQWQPMSPAEYQASEPVRFNPQLEATAAVGQPMLDRTGLPLFVDDDGNGKVPTQPAQPGQGQPARDPWSGALTGETVP